MTLAIIGTAGRGEDGSRLNKEMYSKMYRRALEAVRKLGVKELVSGGAAWADHLAVSLYLSGEVDSLQLYLPAAWDSNHGIYLEENGRYDPGRISNYYHGLFSEAMEGNTLMGIQKAIDKGAEVCVDLEGGFHGRNRMIASAATCMLAFTFGEGDVPKDGGTKYTWDLFEGPKVHVSIPSI